MESEKTKKMNKRNITYLFHYSIRQPMCEERDLRILKIDNS